MDYRTVVFFLCLLGINVLTNGQSNGAEPLTEDCLRCICEASSDCDDDVGCTGAGSLDLKCGSYQISERYWRDGGGLMGDFKKCMRSKTCTEYTIKYYMNRWSSDCNGDSKVDCYDYALIHKNSGPDCRNKWAFTTDFWVLFDSCYSQKLETRAKTKTK